VTWELARGTLVSPVMWLLAAAGLVFLGAGVNSAWLVAGGAVAGLLLR
jgi:hypothetical protein